MTGPGAERVPDARGRFDRGLLSAAVSMGLVGGLVEGAAHMVLQKLAVIENNWFPIIWIASVVDALAAGAAATAAIVGLMWMADRRAARRSATFVVVFTVLLPIVAISAKQWIQPYALAALALGLTTAITRWFARDLDARLRWWARALPWSAGLAALAFLAIEGGGALTESLQTQRLPAARADAPNVLLVVIDALRADHVGSYGYPRQTSHAIDQMASEGVLFENAISTTSCTLPAHASLVTGLDAYQHRLDWNTSHQFGSSGIRRLPEAMLPLGYRTGAFSGNTFYFSREHGFGPGFLHFEDFYHSVPDMFWRTAFGGIATRYVRYRIGLMDLPGRKHADDTVAAVTRWTDRDRERPFFAMINFMDVHDPYLPPQPYRGRFANGGSPGGVLNFPRGVPESLTPGQVQGEMDAYDGAIAYVDDRLATLVATLRSQSPRDLVVVVTSDHGEEFGEHGGYLHARHLYREAIHVPLVVWAPGRVPAGRRVTEPVSIASLPATIMEMLGHPDFPAPSLVPLFGGPKGAWPAPQSLLRHRPWAPEHDPVHDGTLWSVVEQDWHYIEHEGRSPQLFDWQRDPRETTDLSGNPDAAAVRQRMSGVLPTRGARP